MPVNGETWPPQSYDQLVTMGGNVGTSVRSPLDLFSQTVPPEQAADFVRHGDIAAAIIERLEPDVVLWPLRGAAPLMWMCEASLEARGSRMPLFVSLPTGEHVHTDGTKGGLTNPEKAAVLEDILNQLQEAGQYTPRTTRLMIVDEAQKGATLSEMTLLLQERLKANGIEEPQFSVIAMLDSRQGDETRTPHFMELAAGLIKGIPTYTNPMPLITVDVQPLLPGIAELPESNGDPIQRRLKVLENPRATACIKALVESYLHPDSAERQVDAFLAGDMDGELVHKPVGSALLDRYTDPTRFRTPAPPTTTAHWLRAFIRAARRQGAAVDKAS